MSDITLLSMQANFAARFGRSPEVVTRAPGRVNLIGEHVDYNDGLVLPIAITASTWIACAARTDGVASVHSALLNDSASWNISEGTPEGLPHWSSYVVGVAALLRSRNAWLGGFDMRIDSEVEPGAGVSSSAALTVATALALTSLSGEPLDSRELIDLCCTTERDYAGVPCGIMDPTASRLARAGCALLLDCRTREVEHVPLEADRYGFVLINSGVGHELAAGQYAERQRECREAVAYFRRVSPHVRALRDVSAQSARSHALQMDPIVASRAIHVTSEIERVSAAVTAIRAGDFAALGVLMKDSHASLRDQYQVSCVEIDRIVELTLSLPGVLGARMTGGGFGGCVIALVDRRYLPRIMEHPTLAHLQRSVVTPSAGASIELA